MNTTVPISVPNTASYNGTSVPNLGSISLACWLLAFGMLFGLCLPLYVLITNPNLRTPFTHYVTNILTAGLVLVVYVLLIALETGYGVQAVGWVLCPVVDLLFNLGSLVVVYTELAISVTRTWALFFPLHFRHHHNKTLAKQVCVALWIISFLTLLPCGIFNYEYVRQQKEPINQCFGLLRYFQPNYAKILVYLLCIPPVSITLIYPVLYRKYAKLRKTHAELVARHQGPSTTLAPNSPGAQKWNRHELEGFLVLTWIVVCVVVFWTPSMVFTLLRQSGHVPTGQARSGSTWVTLWSLVHVCVEPFLFVLSIQPLRRKVMSLFGNGPDN